MHFSTILPMHRHLYMSSSGLGDGRTREWWNIYEFTTGAFVYNYKQLTFDNLMKASKLRTFVLNRSCDTFIF